MATRPVPLSFVLGQKTFRCACKSELLDAFAIGKDRAAAVQDYFTALHRASHGSPILAGLMAAVHGNMGNRYARGNDAESLVLATEQYKLAAEFCTQWSEPDAKLKEAHWKCCLAWTYKRAGHSDKGFEAAQEALREARGEHEEGERPDMRGEAEALKTLGALHQNMGDFDEAQGCYESALDLADAETGQLQGANIRGAQTFANTFIKTRATYVLVRIESAPPAPRSLADAPARHGQMAIELNHNHANRSG